MPHVSGCCRRAAESGERSACLPAASPCCTGGAGAGAAAASRRLGGRGGLGETTVRIPVNGGLEEPKVAGEAFGRSPCCWDTAADRHACGTVQPLSRFILSSPRPPVPAARGWGCLTAASQGARPTAPSLPHTAPVLCHLWLSYSGDDGRWHSQLHKTPCRLDYFTDF